MREHGNELAAYHTMGYRLAETPAELTMLQQLTIGLLVKKIYGEKPDA